MAKQVQHLLFVLGLLAFGAVLVLGLSVAGYISTATIGKYGLWIIIGLLALYLITERMTKTPWDNVIIGYLLLLSIGGVGATYAIDKGYVTEGAVLLGSLFLVFLMLLAFYVRQPVIGARRR